MAIEELAFKDYQELKDIQKIDLLLIIEFLQKDRKQWINQYSKAHNDYVDLQQENQELKDRIDKAVEIIESEIKEDKENDDLTTHFLSIQDLIDEKERFLKLLKGDKK